MDICRIASRVARNRIGATGPIATLFMEGTSNRNGKSITKWRLDAEGKSLRYEIASGSPSIIGPDTNIIVEGHSISAKKIIEAAMKSPDFGLSDDGIIIDLDFLTASNLIR